MNQNERHRLLDELAGAISDLLGQLDSGEFGPDSVAAIKVTRLRQKLGIYDPKFPWHDFTALGGYTNNGEFELMRTEYHALVSDLLDDLESARQGTCPGKGTDETQPADTLDNIPLLDKENGQRVLQGEAANLVARDVQTLANDRSDKQRSEKAKDGLIGIDRRGRVWRKESENSQKVWYLKERLSAD